MYVYRKISSLLCLGNTGVRFRQFLICRFFSFRPPPSHFCCLVLSDLEVLRIICLLVVVAECEYITIWLVDYFITHNYVYFCPIIFSSFMRILPLFLTFQCWNFGFSWIFETFMAISAKFQFIRVFPVLQKFRLRFKVGFFFARPLGCVNEHEIEIENVAKRKRISSLF